MIEISKADWKLFRARLPDWQESYMEKLNLEYIELLSSDEAASEKFWALEKRIRQDKHMPGVQLKLKKSEVWWDLVQLLGDGAITEADLEGFSEDLKELVLQRVKTYYE